MPSTSGGRPNDTKTSEKEYGEETLYGISNCEIYLDTKDLWEGVS